jgi:hypothetical protein
MQSCPTRDRIIAAAPKRRKLALLDVLAAHQFGRDESYNGHLSDVGNQSKMTQSGPRGGCQFALQQAPGRLAAYLVWWK